MAHAKQHVSQPDSLQLWDEAVSKVQNANAGFAPILAALNRAERTYFAVRKDGDEKPGPGEAEAKLAMDQAIEDERTFGNELFAIAHELFAMPAPHIAGLIAKIEFVEEIGYDGELAVLVLADLRRLQDTN